MIHRMGAGGNARLETGRWTGNVVRRPGDVRSVLMGEEGMEAPAAARALGFSSSAGNSSSGWHKGAHSLSTLQPAPHPRTSQLSL